MANQPCSLQNTGAGDRGEGGQGGGQGSGQEGGQGVCPLEGWSSYVRDHVTVGAGRWRRWRSAAAAGWTSEQPLQDFPHNLVRADLRASWQICPFIFFAYHVYVCGVGWGSLVSGKRKERPRYSCLYCPKKCPKHLLAPSGALIAIPTYY